MTKFYYNPIPLTPTTKSFFPNLRTHYQYHNNDYLFEDDEKIIARVNCKTPKYDIYNSYLEQLEEWTELQCKDLLFDSNIHDWKRNTSELNERIIGRKQLAFIIEDEDGEIFGYFENTHIGNLFNTRIQN